MEQHLCPNKPKRFISNRNVRVGLYAVAFAAAAVLDAVTPLRFADWLLQVILVWIACFWGSKRETRIVAVAGSAVVLAGFLLTPPSGVPLWIGAMNRFFAIGVIWMMTYETNRRRRAEEEHLQDVAHIKVLQGSLPICASCKAVKNEAGEWKSLEHYFSTSSDAQLTHGLCPECAHKYLAELDSILPNR
jgi:hypothetical protein